MKSIVVYSTRSGNTRQIAAAIADVLRSHGPVDLLAAETAPRRLTPGTDLLVVGGPTEGHGMTPPIERFLEDLELTSIDGMAVAAFDTRVRWPKMLSGSAAEGIAKRLTSDGATLIVPPESFIVTTRKPELEPGELPRATAWAGALAEAVSAKIGQEPLPLPR
jgi:flavodoxin